MQVAQSTIANAVKEVKFRLTITNLEKELQQTRNLLQEQGFYPDIPQLR